MTGWKNFHAHGNGAVKHLRLVSTAKNAVQCVSSILLLLRVQSVVTFETKKKNA